MPFEVIDAVSVAAGTVNEDRTGAAPPLAWVIDGATDLLQERLTPAASDAAWLADVLHTALIALSGQLSAEPLAHLPARLAAIASQSLTRDALRAPAARHEHPSAAGLIVRESAGGLEYVTLGDCSLIVQGRTGVRVIGVEAMRGGDTWVRDRIRAIQSNAPEADSLAMRATLWPVLQSKRAMMNTPGGYAIFSITPPPEGLIVAGNVALEPGDVCLLASDGLTRLVDVFATRTEGELITVALKSGLDALIAELRRLECGDDACRIYPRAKTSDDATGLLLRYTA